MKKDVFDVLDTKVSRLGFGCMRFPTTPDGKIDREQAQAMIDYAYENGIKYYDTAWGYHQEESQYFIGEALSKYPRDSFYLTTKLPAWILKKEEDVANTFEEQLTRCQVDYFDYYLMHAMDAERLKTMKEFGAYEYLKEKKEQGIIRHLGFSFHGDLETLETLLTEYEWDFVQLQLNYFDFAYVMSDAEKEYEMVTKHGLPVIVMEPIRGGFLADPPAEAKEIMQKFDSEVSPSSWALRWCADHDNMRLILSGMSAMEHVVENIETFKNMEPLTEEQRDMIEDVAATILSKDSVPCTACGYCMDCPFGVDIPGTFTIFNEYTILGRDQGAKKRLESMKEEGQDYSQCTQCGVCMPQCPQHIQIPDQLARVGALLEEIPVKE